MFDKPTLALYLPLGQLVALAFKRVVAGFELDFQWCAFELEQLAKAVLP